MTDDPHTDAERLRDLERDVRKMANNAAELARQIAFVNPGHEPTLELMASEMDAIATRLAEPRGEAAAPGPYSTVHTPDLAERVEMARAFVGANSPQYVAPTDGPSEDDRCELAAVLRDEWMKPGDRWPVMALAAWRWCHARMAVAPRPPATMQEIAGIIQAHSDKPEISMSRWSRAAREIAARIPAPAVPAEIVAMQHAARSILARYDNPNGSPYNLQAELLRAMVFLREFAARAQPAPAPDPRAAEERGA